MQARYYLGCNEWEKRGKNPAFFMAFFLTRPINTLGGELLISKDLRINDNIRAKEVRLISETGEQLGILSFQEAMELAEKKGLDLVEVAPSANPPVCRLMNYGKHKFEQSKREKEARKKQKIITIKEIKMRPNIDEHDFQVKAKNARKFLSAGDKIKFTIMFRGRQIAHPELGERLSQKFARELSDISTIEKSPKVEGRNMVMILVPRLESVSKEEEVNA